jgi:tRNA(fMet)-specific endonuclease VapC
LALFDTDILIDVLRGVPGSAEELNKYRLLQNYLSAITAGEILFGMKKGEEVPTHKLLNRFAILPVDEELVHIASGVRQRAKGHDLELYDCVIAATAIRHSLTLVTRNARHYPDKMLKLSVPGYKI